jgi:hypothetical protein
LIDFVRLTSRVGLCRIGSASEEWDSLVWTTQEINMSNNLTTDESDIGLKRLWRQLVGEMGDALVDIGALIRRKECLTAHDTRLHPVKYPADAQNAATTFNMETWKWLTKRS